jgi:hypothetical protein
MSTTDRPSLRVRRRRALKAVGWDVVSGRGSGLVRDPERSHHFYTIAAASRTLWKDGDPDKGGPGKPLEEFRRADA